MIGGVRPVRGLVARVASPRVRCWHCRVPARAQAPSTLTQALVQAYNNNATLQEQRASLRATDETVPTAFPVGARPSYLPKRAGMFPAMRRNEHDAGPRHSPAGSGQDHETPENRNESLGADLS